MSHPIKEFEDEEKTVILELARFALGAVFTEFGDYADLSDEYLVELREKIEKVTGGTPNA